MNFNDYKEIIEKLSDLSSSDNEIIVPEKHSWEKEEEDQTFHTVCYYLPFDMYYIPRKFANKFASQYSSKLNNAVYILSGNGKRYCGKAMNGDRIRNHNLDKSKGDWSYQLLFVPNNNHTGSVKYWNVSFMELLETRLIGEFSKYFKLDSNELMNKMNAISEEKAMKNLNKNEDYTEFASIVVDNIITAYINFSKDNFIASDNPKNEGNEEEALKKTPSSPFRFNMVNIKVGEYVKFEPTGIEVKVISDNGPNCIFYDGKKWSLSHFTAVHLPEEMKNSSGAYQGPKYFSYKGKILKNLRDEFEAKSNS